MGAGSVRPHHRLELTRKGWQLRTEVRVQPFQAAVEQVTFDLPAGWGDPTVGPDDRVDEAQLGPEANGKRPVTVVLANASAEPFTLTMFANFTDNGELATVIRGGADDALLDSYQPEREPNLRATIAMAIMMGKTVCITSRFGAWLRDLKFKLARKLGKLPDGPPAYPPITAGLILPGTPAAGSYFPQPIAADGVRLDEVLGLGHWLISREDLANPDLAPFAEQLGRWLDSQQCEAVLVRPDRYVFGTGAPAELAAAWMG